MQMRGSRRDAGIALFCRRRHRDGIGDRRLERENDVEGAATPLLRLHPDPPAVLLDDALADIEPETQPGLGAALNLDPRYAVEAFEQVWQLGVGNPGSLIADREMRH